MRPLCLIVLVACAACLRPVPLQTGRVVLLESYSQRYVLGPTYADAAFRTLIGPGNVEALCGRSGACKKDTENLQFAALGDRLTVEGQLALTVSPHPSDPEDRFFVTMVGSYVVVDPTHDNAVMQAQFEDADPGRVYRISTARSHGYVVVRVKQRLWRVSYLKDVNAVHEGEFLAKVHFKEIATGSGDRALSIDYGREHELAFVPGQGPAGVFGCLTFHGPDDGRTLIDVRGLQYLRRDYAVGRAPEEQTDEEWSDGHATCRTGPPGNS